MCSLRPLEVGVDRFDQPLDTLFEPAVVADRDPVADANSLRHVVGRHRPELERDDPLVQLDRVVDLLLAVLRGDGVGADHEDEAVASFDGRAQRRREHLRVANAFDVDPGMFAALLERSDQAGHECRVAPRIGNEDVRRQLP